MNILSDFEAHKRDEDFDREDAKHRAPRCVCTPIHCEMECPACGGPSAKTPCKAGEYRAPVTHAQKVAFADAMMREPEPDLCEECGGTFDCDNSTCVCRWDGKP